MKKEITLLFLFFIGLITAQNTEDLAAKYAETITIEDMKDDLTILASDALEGRGTGERGQRMAAAYIMAHFQELGLQAPVKNGDTQSYYQHVKLITSKPGKITVGFNGKTISNLKDFLYYGSAQNTGNVETEVVFVGSGSAEEFEGLDVKGKSILAINSNRSNRREITTLAQEKGVKMVFLVRSEDQKEYEEFLSRYGGYFSRGSMSLDKEETAATGGAFYISPNTAGEIFGKPFSKLQEAIAKFKAGKKKSVRKIKSKKVNYSIAFESRKFTSENVLGYLEGTDLKDEVLVLTAHYDHLGKVGDRIFNGADDDGSGTVAIMDIAEAFVKAKADGNGPRRSILFMAVTGEEKGLLGSAYYADNPIFPLENTVADLNIDMIGRNDDRGFVEDYVSLVGSDKLSTELHDISEAMNKKYTKLKLDYTFNDENHPERIYYRSDHWNFAKNGIPVIFYTTGSHEDYHQESDTVDKILFEVMTKRTKLVFYTAWEIVNRDGRLIVDKKPKS